MQRIAVDGVHPTLSAALCMQGIGLPNTFSRHPHSIIGQGNAMHLFLATHTQHNAFMHDIGGQSARMHRQTRRMDQ